MKIEVFKHNQKLTKKISTYFITGLIIILVGSMTGGVATTTTVFEDIDAPTWLYFVTTCISFLLLIILMTLIFAPTRPAFYLKFDSDRIIFSKKNKQVKELFIVDINSIELKPDYTNDKIYAHKQNIFLKIASDKEIINLSLALTKEERETLTSLIQDIISQKS